MENTDNPIGWYEITKDIIIPLLGVISTLVIGIIIALIIKNKERKAKIKDILIDHYMDYLTVRTASVEYEINSIIKDILLEINLESDTYFKGNANWHLPIQIIKERLEELGERLKSFESINTNWSIYTYRFAFLLGKKSYFKEALPLENNITNELLSSKELNSVRKTILEKIQKDSELMSELNSSNSDKINRALNKIFEIVATDFSQYQFSIFNPYNTKLAELINEY
ncbi:hypothetical protein [Seonamhaeicola sp.]|uniref:hypothetical protein n=1 Tax=Seonamhaeicola sp. TaxID=1912245 RepID=UPI00261651DB|nr:hypothetical protein [Seonamhaeicola sp.]